MNIETPADFGRALRRGPFAWPGGYPLFFICSDGEYLSFPAARRHARQICDAIREKSRDGWRVVAVEVNWEDVGCVCAHTGEMIPCAYTNE